jgi:hypothetical protein
MRLAQKVNAGLESLESDSESVGFEELCTPEGSSTNGGGDSGSVSVDCCDDMDMSSDISTCGSAKFFRKRSGTSESTQMDDMMWSSEKSVDDSCCLADDSGSTLADVQADTTLMICNLPCRVSLEEITGILESLGYGGTYDFLHLPTGRNRSNANLGYGFINFSNATVAASFTEEFSNYEFEGYHSKKLLTVKPAHIQGLHQNLSKRNASRRQRMNNMEAESCEPEVASCLPSRPCTLAGVEATVNEPLSMKKSEIATATPPPHSAKIAANLAAKRRQKARAQRRQEMA